MSSRGAAGSGRPGLSSPGRWSSVCSGQGRPPKIPTRSAGAYGQEPTARARQRRPTRKRHAHAHMVSMRERELTRGTKQEGWSREKKSALSSPLGWLILTSRPQQVQQVLSPSSWSSALPSLPLPHPGGVPAVQEEVLSLAAGRPAEGEICALWSQALFPCVPGPCRPAAPARGPATPDLPAVETVLRLLLPESVPAGNPKSLRGRGPCSLQTVGRHPGLAGGGGACTGPQSRRCLQSPA